MQKTTEILKKSTAFLGTETAIHFFLNSDSASASPQEGSANIYAPDFFLEHQEPFFPVGEVLSFPRTTLFATDRNSHEKLSSGVVSRENFVRQFELAKRYIARGEVKKVVPTSEEYYPTPADPFEEFSPHFFNTPTHLFPYGIRSHQNSGMAGASPEILFQIIQRENVWFIETMALAGTRSLTSKRSLLESSKDLEEHRWVVEDINEALSPFGTVFVGETDEHTLPTLVHLRTPIRCECRSQPNFLEVVKALHPTPALGVFPRQKTFRLQREFELESSRNRFGAPFGVLWPSGEAFCIVAIRNVEWTAETTRITAGCGVIDQSTLENEWAEIELKRASIKQMLNQYVE